MTKTPLNEDFEFVILKKILSDKTFAIKTFSIVGGEKIFDKDGANKLYGFIKGYFEKYNRLPDEKAIKFIMSRQEDINQFLTEVELVDNDVLKDEQFILDTTVDYVKRGLLKRALITGAMDIDKPASYGIVEKQIRKALEVSFDIYLGMSFRDDIAKRIKFSRDYSVDGISTGLSQLNTTLKMGNGFLSKNIYIVSSESNLGKSIALVNFAAHSALQGKNVLFVSLEMQEAFIGQRLDAVTTMIDINSIYRTDNEKELLRKHGAISHQMGNADIVIKEYPPGSITVHTLRALCHDLQIYQNFVPDIICVDYLNLMQAARKGDNRYHELKHITEELRALSYEFEAPVITASQVNRSGYQHVSPQLDAMGESMGIVHTADFIIMLSQTDDEKDAGIMQWHVKKNRLGPKDVSFTTNIDYSVLKFTDFTPRTSP